MNGAIFAILACMVFGLIAVPRIVKAVHGLMQRTAKTRGTLPKALKYLFLFDFIWCDAERIFYESRNEQLVVDISKLIEIKYHYRAVTGIIGFLEFVQRNYAAISIDQGTPGMNEVISELERRLPGFKRSSMTECVNDGDLGDTCVIWKAA